MLIYFIIMFTLMFSTTAYAYLDPATTSYVIQVVAGVFIAGGALIGIFWKKIRIFFRNMKMKSLEKKLSAKAARNDKAVDETEESPVSSEHN